MESQPRYFSSRNDDSAEASPLGDIRINYEVIANIVRLSTLEIEGVLAVGSRWQQKFQQVFSKNREAIDGVQIDQEGDLYAVRVRVQMAFGTDLGSVAYKIQDRVRQNLQDMANLSVSRVDVVVDSVQMAPAEVQTESKEA